MSDENTLHLSLLDNSHAFLNESVRKALSAQSNINEWQFAIISLVQSLELSLKSMLYSIHPVLIYESIDSPKHTVSATKALNRLSNSEISNVEILSKELEKIQKAIDLRNQFIHSDFTVKAEYAAGKFFEVFAVVTYFQAKHLKTEIEDIVDLGELDQLLKIKKGLLELVKKARERIKEDNINPELIWGCTTCGQDTFVAEDGRDICYTCRYSEEVVECSHCNNIFLKGELESFENELDIDWCEGQSVLHNSFGYSDFFACADCLPNIKNDIQNQRWDEEHLESMEEYYSRF